MIDTYQNELFSILNKAEITTNGSAKYEGNKIKSLDDLISFFKEKRNQRKTIFFIGNGGSAGIALHMATDFMKNGKMLTQTFFDPTLIFQKRKLIGI